MKNKLLLIVLGFLNTVFAQDFKSNTSGKLILFDSNVPKLEVKITSKFSLPYLYDKNKQKDTFSISFNSEEKVRHLIEPIFTKNVLITDGLLNCSDCKIKFLDEYEVFNLKDFYINYSNPILHSKDNSKSRIRLIEPVFTIETNKVIGIRNYNETKFVGNKQLYDPVFGSKSSILASIGESLAKYDLTPKIFKKGMKEVQAAKFYISLQPSINNYFYKFFESEYPDEKYNPLKNGYYRTMISAMLQIDWNFSDPSGKVLFSIPTRVIMSKLQNDSNEMFKIMLAESIKSLMSDADLYNKIKTANAVLESNLGNKNIELPSIPSNTFTDLKSMISKSREGVVTIFNTDENSFGSGFIVSDDGHIVTNYHVIENNKTIKVQFYGDTSKVQASLLDVNEDVDLALLKIDKKKVLNPLMLTNSSTVDVGENVFAIGTPGDTKLSQSVTKGIISGKREIEDKNYFQTDVSINFGNSGGPLINEKGEVIGVVVMKIVGRGVEGLSFVIPSNEVLNAFKIKYK